MDDDDNDNFYDNTDEDDMNNDADDKSDEVTCHLISVSLASKARITTISL